MVLLDQRGYSTGKISEGDALGIDVPVIAIFTAQHGPGARGITC